MTNRATDLNDQRPDGRPAKTDDPQITVTGTMKVGPRSDIIVFTIPLSIFEIVAIVTIPEEGTNTAPVYLKFRLKRP